MSFLKQITIKFFSRKTKFTKYLYQILGFYPENLVFYSLAFKHKSKHRENNERLEFLGDSILDAVVSKELYFRFHEKNEGDLSKLRSKIVNRTFLNNLGKTLSLEKHLSFKLTSNNVYETNIIGNTFEALIGAIYLDGGIDLAEKFISTKVFNKDFNWEEVENKIWDFKSKLIQYAQKKSISLEYITIGEERTDNNFTKFEVLVKLDGKDCLTAKGLSKKKAEQLASKMVFEGF